MNFVDGIARVSVDPQFQASGVDRSSSDLFSVVAKRVEALEGALSEVQASSVAFAQGKSTIPTHELMIRMEAARLDLTLALQVRNRIVETVQEIYRTQV